MIPDKAQKILDFWFKETPADKRFKKDDAFDQTIRDKFLDDYELASQNEYDDWQDQPMSTLALIILFDQFSRNMFRDNKKAFAQDHKARLIVNDAVYAGYLETMNESQRLFMLLPLILHPCTSRTPARTDRCHHRFGGCRRGRRGVSARR